MSLARKEVLLFGGNGVSVPTNILAQFGSLAASAPAFSSDPAVIQSLAAWVAGWADATILAGSPPQPVPTLQDLNAALYVITYVLQYLQDRGIPEWSSLATFGLNSFCQVSGHIYLSKVTGNINNAPASSPTQWTDWNALFDAAGAAAAAQAAAAADATTKANAAQAAAISSSNSYTNSQIADIAPELAQLRFTQSRNVPSGINEGTVSFDISSYGLSSVPGLAFIQLLTNGGTPFVVRWNPALSSATTLVAQVKALDGALLDGMSYSFGVVAYLTAIAL